MRKTLLLTLALAGLMLGTSRTAMAGGGPDIYGYIWLASTDAGGPTYNWTDITTKPGAVKVTGLTDDNSKGLYPIGWDFHYYWSDYNEVKIGSNGWVGFNNISNIAHCFPTIPTPAGAGDNFLAPFMSDLCFNCGGSPTPECWYWSNGVDSFIVSYINVPWWFATAPGFAGSNTFQIVLDGQDSSITFHYNTMDETAFNNTAGCAADLEIGIENLTGNIGLESYLEIVPADNFSIRYDYPATVTFAVPDCTPEWNANTDNKGQFVLVGTNYDLTTNIANVGNADVTTNITVDGEVRGLSPTDVRYTGSTVIAGGVDFAADTMITFSPAWMVDSAGQYYYQVDISSAPGAGSDINPSNNSNTVEVSALPVDSSVCFTYQTGNPPDGVVAWAGGGGGAGIQIVSPVFPVTVVSTAAYIVDWDGDPGTTSATGFYMKIHGDDGTGNPGALLDSVFVDAASVVESDWNTQATASSPIIASGPFYVSWWMEADQIGLGTESFGPISRRTYEILGGSWAGYRDASVTDFLIEVCAEVPVGVKNAVQSGAPAITVAPNPSSDVTSVGFYMQNAGDARVNVMTVTGQTVFSREFSDLRPGLFNFSLNTGDFSNGVYFVTLETGNSRSTTKLVVAK